MCGVAGFVDHALTGEDASVALRMMAGAIERRGPNGEGFFHDPEHGVALAHKRLAIIDITSFGAQPMTSACGRYVLSFNGEIYNFGQIRQKIDAARGWANWRSRSDTEVLLEAIAQFGIDGALQLATGMFAFALWDKSARILYLARDRFGEKPLFYFRDGEKFAFSSQLSSIAKFPSFSARVNEDSLCEYLQFGYVPGDATLLCNVRKILPGHYLTVAVETSMSFGMQRYWDPKQELFDQPKAGRSLEDNADRLEEILTAAIDGQMIADVSLGSFLSAGIDSSLICSIIRKKLDRPLLTFSMGFADKRYDESEGARAIAGHLGTEHHEHIVDKQDVIDIVRSVPDIFDEPLGDTSVLPTFLVCQMARKHVTVALSGDGGDELFGGYRHYRWGPRLLRGVQRIPRPARSAVGALATKIGSVAGRRSVAKLGHLIREAGFTDPAVLLNGSLIDAKHGVGRGASDRFLEAAVRDLDLPLDQRLMALDLFGFLPDDILCKVDRAAMHVSLETRAPFLDRHVAKFAWSLPPEMTARGHSSKLILRSLLSRYLPAEIVDRPKQGFGIPLDDWFRKELRPFVEEKLDILKSKYGHLVRPRFVETYWQEHLAGRFNWQREIWTLVVLVMFLDTYF